MKSILFYMLDFLIMVQRGTSLQFRLDTVLQTRKYKRRKILGFYFIIFVFHPFSFSFKIFLANSQFLAIAVLGTNYKYDMLSQLQEKPPTNPPDLISGRLRPARQHFCLRQAKVAKMFCWKFCCSSFGLEMAGFA